jgi:Zn-dependent protease
MSDDPIWTPIEAPALAGPGLAGPPHAPPVVVDEPPFGAATPPSPPAEDPFGRQRSRSRLRNRAASAAAGLAALVAKFGAALKALLVALPNLKLLTTAGTALVSVAAYSIWFGWTFAIGFVVLLFVHEMGHVIALRREGIRASAPMFIPFLGAVISARSLGDNALAEARVGLAGPVLGSLGALVVAIAGWLLHSDFLLALAYIGFFINLFNLLPIVPLDGGRAAAAMSPWMWFLGFGGLVFLLFALPQHNPILLIIVIFAGFQLLQRWRHRNSGTIEAAAYYRVRPRQRLMVAAVYIGLIVALVFGMDATHILATGGHSFTSL